MPALSPGTTFPPSFPAPARSPWKVQVVGADGLSADATDLASEALLATIGRLLVNILDEQRATRLAVQDFVNSGRDDPVDYLDLARELREDDDEE